MRHEKCPTTVINVNNGTTMPEGTEGQLVGFDADGELVAVDPPQDNDHYVEGAAFDDETRTLNLTRTEPLAPLSVVIPSDATELPDGTEGQLVGYDEDGELVAVDPPQDNDHFVEGATFDDATRTLTLTRTAPLTDLTVEIPSDATELPAGTEGQVIGFDADGEPIAMNLPTFELPEGTHGEVIQYDENGEPVTGLVGPISLLGPVINEYPSGTYVPVVFVDGAGNSVYMPTIASNRADDSGIPVKWSSNIGGQQYHYLLTQTIPDVPIGGDVNQEDVVVNKGYLNERLDDLDTLPALASGVLTSDGTTAEFKYPAVNQLVGDDLVGEVVLGHVPFYDNLLQPIGSKQAHSDPNAHTLVLRRSNGRVGVGTPTANTDATSKLYVDDAIDTRVENAGGVSAMRRMTQAAYDALSVKDPNTFYVIVG